MRFYIRIADMERVDKGCDLGDSVGVRVYLYPHKDDLAEMVECQTADHDEEMEGLANEATKRLGW